MQIKNIQFKPGFLATALALALVVFLSSLGIWQLNRATEKTRDQERRTQNIVKTIDSFPGDLTHLPERVGARVRVRGQFVTDRQAALANSMFNHRPGFYVLVPFKIHNRSEQVLVMRGWIPPLTLSHQLPTLPAVNSENFELEGIIDRPPAVGIKLGKPDAGYPTWPKLLSYVDMKWYSEQMGVPFLPVVLKQTAVVTAGVTNDWAALGIGVNAMPAVKHLGYAFQWFALALVFLVVFIVVNLKRRVE